MYLGQNGVILPRGYWGFPYRSENPIIEVRTLILHMVPDCARVIIMSARDFSISYRKIENSREVTRNRPLELIMRMWNDAPEWMSSLCKLCILAYYSTEQANNRYGHHFKSITFDTELPDGQFICLSLLNGGDLGDLEKKRRTQIAEWIHA